MENNKITFECEVITPMFIYGQDQQTPEIRGPSIKGALRFWWRAINANNQTEQLHTKEGNIFGETISEKGSKSKVAIRVQQEELISKDDDFSGNKTAKNPEIYENIRKNIQVNPINYLGYGVYEHSTKWKKYIAPNSKFKIILKFNPLLKEQHKDEVIQALKFLSVFGGIGAKSRNGFGKFKLLNQSIDLEEYYNMVAKDNNKASSYSHISKQASLFILRDNFSSWREALSELGEIYRIAKLNSDGEVHQYDKRKFIAAPIGRKKDEFLRKTKPYFINVWKNNENSFSAFILYLPYFQLINNREIYSRGFKSSFPEELKEALNTFNTNLELNNNIMRM